MTAEAWPLRFRIGARTLASVPRRLVRVSLSLDEALAGRAPALPPLGRGEHGWFVTSLPVAARSALDGPDSIALLRQRYVRRYVDLHAGEAAWWAGLSAKARSQLRRKAARAGGVVERVGTPDELSAFLPVARALAATTYQARLLGDEFPPDAQLLALAAADRVRGWLLRIEGRPVAFLLGGAQGDALRYDHVGHDPAFADRSPGSVLQLAALQDLFAEGRFARFDFLEGDGQHKRQFATGGVDCCDLLLLRPSLPNRLAGAALTGWDAAVDWAKRSPALRHAARTVGR